MKNVWYVPSECDGHMADGLLFNPTWPNHLAEVRNYLIDSIKKVKP